MKIDFNKYPDKLVPVIIQDSKTNIVLMLGFMNEEALAQTLEEGKVTFFSRSKRRLWTKGETSGNYLLVKKVMEDCDNDTILIKAEPLGPVCHTGADTCFSEENVSTDFLQQLERVIDDRRSNPIGASYVSSLFERGINTIAQKVGEEAVELVIEAKDNNDLLFRDEAADLLFHFLILLNAKGHRLSDIVDVLRERHK